MARKTESRSKGNRLYCPSCREDFLAYRIGGDPRCPHCGRPVRTMVHRRYMRFVAMGLLLVLVAVALIAYYLRANP